MSIQITEDGWPVQMVPAQPGYRIVEIITNENGQKTPRKTALSVIAWFIEAQNTSTGNVLGLVDPITEDGSPPRYYAIQTPNGDYILPGEAEFESLSDLQQFLLEET